MTWTGPNAYEQDGVREMLEYRPEVCLTADFVMKLFRGMQPGDPDLPLLDLQAEPEHLVIRSRARHALDLDYFDDWCKYHGYTAFVFISVHVLGGRTIVTLRKKVPGGSLPVPTALDGRAAPVKGEDGPRPLPDLCDSRAAQQFLSTLEAEWRSSPGG